MYDLFVLICLATEPNICITLEDLSNPYETLETCVVRAYDIKKNLPLHYPEYEFDTYECSDEENSSVRNQVLT